MEGLVSSRAGDGSLPSPAVGFRQGGTALYFPLCLVLYRGTALLSSVFDFIEQGGDGSLPSPVSAVM